MSQIRKVGDTYYIEFYARGLLYSQVAGPDYDAAKRLLDATEAKIAGGEALTIVREIDLAVFFEQFLGYASNEFGLASCKRFKRLIAHLTAFLQSQYPQACQVSKITPSIIESYKNALVVSVCPKLVNFTLLLLREVLEYGIRLGFINDNPTVHVRLLTLPLKYRPKTARYQVAEQLFSTDVPIGKACKLLKLSDIGKMMYFAHLIPIVRKDIYK